MTLGRQLRPDKAVAAAHTWIRGAIKVALVKDFPTDAQKLLYNDAAIDQIRAIVLDVIHSFEPSAPRRAEWD